MLHPNKYAFTLRLFDCSTILYVLYNAPSSFLKCNSRDWFNGINTVSILVYVYVQETLKTIRYKWNKLNKKVVQNHYIEKYMLCITGTNEKL